MREGKLLLRIEPGRVDKTAVHSAAVGRTRNPCRLPTQAPSFLYLV
jgi:hypothetical protein